MNEKIIIAFAFIIFVISIGVFSYLYLFPGAIIPPATEAIPVTDLNKVLQEEFTQEIKSEFGYSVKFPADFVIRKLGGPDEVFYVYNYDPSSVRSVEGFSEDQIRISIGVADNSKGLSVKDWFLSFPFNGDCPVTINSLISFSFLDREGIRVNTTDCFGGDFEEVSIPLNNYKILGLTVVPVNLRSLVIFNKVLDSLQLK